MAALVGSLGAFYAAKHQALSFANSGDYVTIADPTGGELDFSGTQDFSIEVWTTADADAKVINKNSAEVGYGISIAAGGLAQFILDDGTSDVTAAGSGDISDAAWHHIVGSRDAGTMSYVYVDGEKAGSDTDDAGSIANGSDVIIGPDATANTKTAMVRIYNTLLTDAQVSDLYSGDFSGALKGSLVGEWMFYEGENTNLHDSGGKGNVGTNTGGTWVTTTYDAAVAEAVGTGTGSLTVFNLDYENVDNANLTVTVGGTAKRRGADFDITPKGTITFHTAPVSDAAVVATYRHYKMVLEAGGFTSWSINPTADTQETTDFRTTGWREFVPTLKSWTGSAERHWINPITQSMIGNKYILKFFTDEANGKYYTGWGIVTGAHPSESVDALLDESLDFQGTYILGNEAV